MKSFGSVQPIQNFLIPSLRAAARSPSPGDMLDKLFHHQTRSTHPHDVYGLAYGTILFDKKNKATIESYLSNHDVVGSGECKRLIA